MVGESAGGSGGGFSVNPSLLADGDEETADGGLPDGVYPEGTVVPPEREELFRVEGKIYTVPKRIDPGIAFRYMKSVRKGRGDQAAADMLYDVLGEAVIDVLAADKLDQDQVAAVMKAAEKYAMSAIRKTLGN
jgi:hypothetical protein